MMAEAEANADGTFSLGGLEAGLFTVLEVC